ncbi:alginate export family protein [Solitalea longa]|uniref:alginate export family protein n=1 Tax=Solitalea longa TaxID=2079460 RepID=UPI0013FDB543|nr:alginate export family protein [Solitalea longa]
MKKVFTLIFLIGGALTVQAQNIQLSAEYRPRFEYRDGAWKMRPANDVADNPAALISQRARLNFNFTDKSSKLKLGASLQDVRTWGSAAQLNVNNPNSFDIHQFWGEILFTERFSLKVGRQELAYDNQRIIGAVDWTQQGRAFDAAVLKYEDNTKNFKVHAGLGLNTKADTSAIKQSYTGINNYKTMQYLWAGKKFSDKLNASFLFLNNGMEYTRSGGSELVADDRRVAYSQTTGSRIEFRPAKFGVNLEGYYQSGKNSKNISLSAWQLNPEAFIKLNNDWSMVGGAEWLSGTDQDNTDGKDHSFSPLYGTNHKFNGYMDYFYVGNRLLTGKTAVGLADYYLGARYAKNKFNTELTFHQFNAMATVLDPSLQKMESNLGIEGDLALGYKLTEAIAFQGGLSFYSGTSTLQQLQAGSDHTKLNSWGWLQINIKPTLFNYSK